MYARNTVLAAALGLLSCVTVTNAHMIMANTVPYGKSTLNNSPLAADGSDFPCKQRTGVYDAEGADNQMALGSTQELSFTGTAVHGGGSCQVAITYDDPPTASSSWKVIHSIIGGCPARGQTGNLPEDNADFADPDTYNFTIPDGLATGKATLAWMWNNKIGNREAYMNCAPVTFTSGSSKRDVSTRDTNAFFQSLPDMFKANIGNQCATVDSTDVIYPNPGDSVDYEGQQTSSAQAAPTGSGCQTPSGSAAAATSGAATSVAASAESTSAGGVFVAPSSAASSAEASVAAPSSVVVVSVAVASSSVAAPSAAATASGGNSSTAGAQVAGTACTTEGEFNCIGGTSFQQCASGVWSVVQQMAAGTTCTSGQSTSMQIEAASKHRRGVRFSHGHRRYGGMF